MLAVKVPEELAAEEISELLSDDFSRGLTLKYLHPLIKVVVLVQGKLPSLPDVSTWPLPAGGAGGAGRAWWPLRPIVAVDTVGPLRTLGARSTWKAGWAYGAW